MTPPIIRHRSGPPATPPNNDNRNALILAVAVHLLLLVALIFGVSWRTEAPGPVEVQLWADGNSPVSPPPTPQPEPVSYTHLTLPTKV